MLRWRAAQLPQTESSDPWFVARTQPRRERWAAENVARAGAFYYLPEQLEVFRVTVHGHRKREYRVRPLFPSYLFVRHPDKQWHFLMSTLGIVGLILSASEKPAQFPNSELEKLRQYEHDGLITLPANTRRFTLNQPVRITEGAYAGYVGLVQGNYAHERVRILLDFLNRKVPHLIEEARLEAA